MRGGDTVLSIDGDSTEGMEMPERIKNVLTLTFDFYVSRVILKTTKAPVSKQLSINFYQISGVRHNLLSVVRI